METSVAPALYIENDVAVNVQAVSLDFSKVYAWRKLQDIVMS